MPLPDGGVWPPKDLAQVYQRLAAWSAWYSGNPDDLSYVYGNQFGQQFDSTAVQRVLDRPSQYKGGVVGWFARFFWGEPTNSAQKRAKLHVPIGGDLARTSAELLFSEPPEISLPEDMDDQTTADRLEELVDDGVHAALLEGAEVCAALGGVYLAVCWDKETSDKPWLAVRHPDAAVPEWRYGQLSAVTFWQVLVDDGKEIVRHLERHEPGQILHGVYVGDTGKLGKQVSLDAYPTTQGLLPVVPTGLDGLTAVYVPNMRPNRLWRNLPAAAHLGRSDFSGVEPVMDALDETYTSWMRDVRLGKARLVVPEDMLQSLGAGSGSRFDADREVYEGLNMLVSPGQSQITNVQFNIRHAEHLATATHQLEQIVRGAGYSTQTFGIAEHGRIATATEITARERSSVTTRNRKINYWRPALAEALETLLAIDAKVFGSGVTAVKPNIEWGDYIGEDPTQIAQTASALRTAEAASTDTLVRLVHPEWDDDQIEAEVQLIKDETPGLSPPAPVDLGMGGVAGAGVDPLADPSMADPNAVDPNAMAAVNGY